MSTTICQNCNKTFKGQKGLKVHQRMSQACNPANIVQVIPEIITPIVVPEPVIMEVIEEIDEITELGESPVYDDDESYISDNMTEIADEINGLIGELDDEDLPEFEVQVQWKIEYEPEPIVISRAKVTTCEISTQTNDESVIEQIKKPLKEWHADRSLLKSLQDISVESAGALQLARLDIPQITEIVGPIVDIRITSDLQLRIIQRDPVTGDHVVKGVQRVNLLNQYTESPIDIDMRVQKHDIQLLGKRSMVDYKFDKKDSQIHNACSTNKSPFGILNKILNDNRDLLVFESVVPDMLFWDIETFKTPKSKFTKKVPMHDDPEAHISMICVYNPNGNKLNVWLRTIYTFDISAIVAKLQSERQIAVSVHLEQHDDDYDLCFAFLQFIQAFPRLNILCGFNASQGKPSKKNQYFPNCYDMNFIISKCHLNTKMFSTRKEKFGNQPEIMITGCSWLPKTLFMDFKMLATPKMFGQEHRLESYSLKSTLEFLGLPSKLDMDHITMNHKSNIPGVDMSLEVAYCAFDCIALHLADQKHSLIMDYIQLTQITEVPISTMATLQTPQQILISIIDTYLKAGYHPHFDYLSEFEETRPKHGALTEAISPDQMYMLHENVDDFDYSGQYTSAIQQMNICCTTLRFDSGKYRININYGKPLPEHWVYFDESPSPLITLIGKLERLKAMYPKNSPQYKACKKALNSCYGILGQSSSPIYNYYCMTAITGFARESITYAKELALSILPGAVIQVIDTDGLSCKNQASDDQVKEYVQAIQSKWHKMKLEYKRGNQFIYNGRKKAYACIKPDTGLELKGFGSKNSVSKPFRNRLNDAMLDLFAAKPQGRSDIYKFVSEYVAGINRDLKVAINQAKVNEDISYIVPFAQLHRFTKAQTKSGNLTKSGYLEQQHGYKTQYQIFALNMGQRQADHNYKDVSEMTINDLSKINICKQTEFLSRCMVNFFKDTKNKTQELLLECEEGQIMIRIEPKNSIKLVDPEDVEAMLNPGVVCLQEKIMGQRAKLYFDIETKVNEGHLYMVDLPRIIQIIQRIIGNEVPLHIACGNIKSVKESYHIICDVIMLKTQMQCLALYINQTCKYELCDLAVYKDDQTMRLPQQFKCLPDGTFGTTMLKIISASTFDDFLISNIHDTNFKDMCEPLAYINKTIFSKLDKAHNTRAQQFLIDNFQLHTDLSNGYLIPKIKPYKCPCSGRMHESQNLTVVGLKIRCFSKDAECAGKYVSLSQEDNAQPIVCKPATLKKAMIQNQQYVDYSISESIFTFVKSHMGTGKTVQLQKELARFPEYTVIAISFRKTFATFFSQKLGFIDYQKLSSGSWGLNNGDKICVQFDSLYKLNLSCIDRTRLIIVLDEIESTLCQINSFISKKATVRESAIQFLNILQQNAHCVVLDALLQQATIDAMLIMAKCENYQVIQNMYQPKLNQKAVIIRGTQSRNFQNTYVNKVLAQLKEGRKVATFCTSITLAKQLQEACIKALPELSIKLYHGDDSAYDKVHQTTMRKAKQHDLQDVNEHWSKCQLLIYTATITAGVSFDLIHFDNLVAYYASQTSDVIGFIQGLQRIRTLTDQELCIYHDVTQTYSNLNTPARIAFNNVKVYNNFIQYSELAQLEMFVKARSNDIDNNRNHLLTQLIADQGYIVEGKQSVHEKLTDLLHNVETIDFGMQLTQEDVGFCNRYKHGNDKTERLESEVGSLYHMSRLMAILGSELDEFNALTVAQKQDAHKNLESIIKRKAVTHMLQANDILEFNRETLDQSLVLLQTRLNQEHVRSLAHFDLTASQINKSHETLKDFTEQAMHLKQIIQLEDQHQYIKDQVDVKKFNIAMEQFDIKLDRKQKKVAGKNVTMYILKGF